MPRIPDEIVNEIFAKADILEIIQEDLPDLKKKNRNWWAKSPWTNEKTPSFAVSPSKGIFKDWSSGKGGNVVQYLIERHDFTYREALEWLARRYEIEIPQEEVAPDSRTPIYQALKAVAEEWHELAMENDQVLSYLLDPFEKAIIDDKETVIKRGFSFKAVREAMIGYCPPTWSCPINEQILLDAGIIQESEDGQRYMPFRGRIIYPVRDVLGRVVAFSGGKIPGMPCAMRGKYINSGDTRVYQKGKHLYGLYEAKRHIRSEGYAILVEGAPDRVGLRSAGVRNVVGPLGTGFTVQQAQLLSTITEETVIAFDREAKNERISLNICAMLASLGQRPSFWLVPYGLDPDEHRTTLQDCAGAIKTEKLGWVDRMYHIWKRCAKSEEKERLMAATIKHFCTIAAACSNEIDRVNAVKIMSTHTDIPYGALMTEVVKLTEVKVAPSAFAPAAMGPVESFMALICAHPDKIPWIREAFNDEFPKLHDDQMESIRQHLFEGKDLTELSTGEQASLFTDLSMREIEWDEEMAFQTTANMLFYEIEQYLSDLDDLFIGAGKDVQIEIIKQKEYITKAKHLLTEAKYAKS